MKITKNWTQKIAILIVIVFSFNFVTPIYSQASFGGVLLGPVVDVVTAIFDSIMGGLQAIMYDGTFGYSVGNEGMLGGFLGQASELDELKQKYPSLEYDDSNGTPKKTIKVDDLDRGWFANSVSAIFGFTANDDNFGIPIIKYSPEKIFSGEVPALDVNFLSPKKWSTYENTGGSTTQAVTDVANAAVDVAADNLYADRLDGTATGEAKNLNDKSITQALQGTISDWYKSLRNLAIVGLLSVLLYVGIRIIVSSASSDKAKYKQMLADWFIALCLVVALQYIMVFTLTVVEMITEGIGNSSQVAITVEGTDDDIKFNTDLTGFCRFQVQYSDLSTRLIYLVLYIALCIYTLKFTWTYLKRSITMAFLTLMAPLVALTYPIDKMRDGSAQAFNSWLKEYVFNALLQPFHLILYTIFLGSAMNIAVDNPIYAIIFLAFISPAEKILRGFFGFDKASTAAGTAFAGGVTGAAMMSMAKGAVTKIAGSSGKNGSGGRSDKIKEKSELPKPESKNELGKDAGIFSRANINAGQGQEQEGIQGGGNNSSRNNQQGNDRNARLDEIARQRGFEDAEDAWLNGEDVDSWLPDESQDTNGEQPAPIRFANTGEQSEDEGQTDPGIRFANNGEESEDEGQEQADPGIRFANNGEPPADGGQQDGQGAGQQETRRGGFIGGVRNVASKPARYTGDKIRYYAYNPEGKKKLRQTLRNAAVKTITTGAGLAVGIGAGITGDDLGDIAKGAAAGMGAGNIVGGMASKRIGSATSAVRDAYREGKYGNDLPNIEAREYAQTWAYDDNNRTVMMQKRNLEDKGIYSQEVETLMNRGSEYVEQGITEDVGSISKALKLEDDIKRDLEEANYDGDKNQLAKEEAMYIERIVNSDEFDSAKFKTDEKYQESWQRIFKRSLKKTGINDNRKLDNQSTYMLNLLKKRQGVD